MDDPNKIIIEFTREELQVLITATGSASPSKADEIIQFKLYHKLVFKFNEIK